MKAATCKAVNCAVGGSLRLRSDCGGGGGGSVASKREPYVQRARSNLPNAAPLSLPHTLHAWLRCHTCPAIGTARDERRNRTKNSQLSSARRAIRRDSHLICFDFFDFDIAAAVACVAIRAVTVSHRQCEQHREEKHSQKTIY